jgi:hypothetical protein
MSTATQEPCALIDFQRVVREVPLRTFLEARGHRLQRDGEYWRTKCPIHHEKHGASFMLYGGGRWFCHGQCAASYPKGGDVVDLAGILWGLSDRLEIVTRLLGEVPKIDAQARQTRQDQPARREPRWPARNLEQIDAIVRAGYGLYDLCESSPVRFDDDANHAEEIIDILFPGDPLLCVGETEYKFATESREDWRGQLAQYPFIVPNPMLRKVGTTASGKLSQHTFDATASRVYLVIECDFKRIDHKGNATVFLPLLDAWDRDGIEIQDACAAILMHLAHAQPLVTAVHSGNRSIHGWFAAFDREPRVMWAFMRRAFSLGADHVTWTHSQFVRLPDGRRQNGKRQATFYLDPMQAVKP